MMHENTISEDVKNEEMASWDMDIEKIIQEEKDNVWKSRTGLTEDTLRGAIEAIIYMSDKPLSVQKIKKSIDPDIPLRLIQSELEKLQEEFDRPEHGLRLIEVAEGYQFRTKILYSKVLNQMYKAPVISLSPLALEVLSVIAFKQPISKMEIDQMRGVDSGHLIRGLIDKGLLKVVGRSEEVGKPVTYGTTNDFLSLFELNELDDLPTMSELSELAQKNGVGDIEEIRELVKVDKDKFMYDEMEEVDKLRDQIKSIKTNTSFTKELNTNSKKKEVEDSKSAFDVLEEFVQEAKVETQVELEEPVEEEVKYVPAEDLFEDLVNETLSEVETASEVAEEKKEEPPKLFDDEQELERLLDDAFSDFSGSEEKNDDDIFSDGENLHESEISRIQAMLKDVENSKS